MASKSVIYLMTGLVEIHSGKSVANALGISEAYVSDIKNGKRDLSIPVAKLLERYYKVDGLKLLKEQLKEQWNNYEFSINPKQEGAE